MWTKRRNIAVKEVPTQLGVAPVLTTPAFTRQQCDTAARAALTLDEAEFNFVSSLVYTMVPQLSREDAQALLPWVMARWHQAGKGLRNGHDSGDVEDPVKALQADAEVCAAFSQVEYFFAGTDNGHLFVVPLVPTHFLALVATKYGERFPALVSTQTRASAASTTAVPVNCGAKRVLHRHICEEPVIALDLCGTLVASAALADTSIAVSMFHPHAVPVALIAHAKRVRSLRLWEGGPFARRPDGAAAATGLRRRWHDAAATQEPAAVYLFAGEELDAVVRLFRIDVVHGTYSLLHVFVVTPNLTGLPSPLAALDREDSTKQVTQRETDCAIHCLAIDDDRRLLAGMEGGICVWALHELPFPAPRPAVTDEDRRAQDTVDPMGHALCWEQDASCPMLGVMLASAEGGATAADIESHQADTEAGAAAVEMERQVAARHVRRRAVRLVNQHVWVRDAVVLKHALCRPAVSSLTVKKEKSKWKPKYAHAIAGGVAVGVVSNEVAVPMEQSAEVAELLSDTVVTVGFESGEVKNDVNLPLSCVQPVVYPLCWLRMSGNACFALAVLQHGKRVVSSGSDGRVAVWFWETDAPAGTQGTYLPYLVAGKSHGARRGIGRHVCVMRSPDVFLSCGFDDGVVREWHVFDAPERLLRCERRFTMLPAADPSSAGGSVGNQLKELAEAFTNESKREGGPGDGRRGTHSSGSSSSSSAASNSDDDDNEGGDGTNPFDGVAGISSAVALPLFGAVFLVGVFEPTIQTFSLSEVQGCEAPANYIYNGFKTLKIPSPPSSLPDGEEGL